MRPNKGFPREAVASALIVVLVSLVVVNNYFQDDAYISFRYAQVLADHGSLYYNVGEEGPVGFTNPLYVYLLAAAYLLTAKTIPIEIISRLIASGALLFVLVFMTSRSRALIEGGRYRWVRLMLPGFLFLVFPFSLVNFFCGLETPLLTATLCVLLFLALVEEEPRDWLFAIATGVTVALRFEAAVCVFPIVACYVLKSLRAGRRRILWLLLWAGIASLAVLSFHVFLTGCLVPLSFVTKQRSGFEVGTFVGYARLWALVLFPLLFVLCWLKKVRQAQFCVLFLTGVSLFYSFFVFWLFYRYLFPFLFATFVVASMIVFSHRRRLGAPYYGVGLAFLVLVSAPTWIESYSWCSGYRAATHSRVRVIAEALLDSELPASQRCFAAYDAGYLAYVTGWKIIDLTGLTTPEVLHQDVGALVQHRQPPVLIISVARPIRRIEDLSLPSAYQESGSPIPKSYRFVREVSLNNRYWHPHRHYSYFVFVNELADPTMVNELQARYMDIEATIGFQKHIARVIAMVSLQLKIM